MAAVFLIFYSAFGLTPAQLSVMATVREHLVSPSLFHLSLVKALLQSRLSHARPQEV
jgi:hypothetical protein